MDIVIPVLNEADNLKILLPYLIKYAKKYPVHILVVDAAVSSDDSKNICSTFGVSYYKSKHTQRSKQMNECFTQSKGDCILFVHADVLPPTDYYEAIQQAAQKGFDAGCFAYQFKSNHLLLKINSAFTKYDGIFTGGGDQCHFVRRSVFKQLGGYNDNYVIMEDFEFYERLKKATIPFTILPNKATVSARKYINNSYLRVNLVNLIALIKFRQQADPKSIKEFYMKWLK